MAGRVGADDGDLRASEVASRPYRSELRIHPVGATPRVGPYAHVDDGGYLPLEGLVYDALVLVVGREDEVAPLCPAAVVQVELGVEHRDAQRLAFTIELTVVDEPGLTRLLDVDDPLRVVLGRDDRGHAGSVDALADALLVSHRRDDLEGLEREPVHDREVGRPVAALDHVVVDVALHLRGLDATSIEARARLRDDLGDLRPEVYEARLAVAPHCLEVAP